jgi:Spy/CpxP family protein refolding chaperone
MRQIVMAALVIAGVLGSGIPATLDQVAAADEGWGGPGMMRWHRMPPEMMRGAGLPGPWGHGRGGHEGPLISMMLHWRDQLALTGEQERSLRELRANFEKEAIKRTSEIDVAELELKELLEQEKVDLAKVEAATKKVALLRAELRLARIKTIEAGKAVLSPDQQRKFERLGHDPRMGEPGRGMMGPGRGMMGPGMGPMPPPMY